MDGVASSSSKTSASKLKILGEVSISDLSLLLTDQSDVLTQQKIQDLVSEVDPKQVLDEDVEEVRKGFLTPPTKHSCNLFLSS